MDCGPAGGMRVENFIVTELSDLDDVQMAQLQSVDTPNGLNSAMQNPALSVRASNAFFSNDDLSSIPANSVIQNQPTPAPQTMPKTLEPTPASKIRVSRGATVTKKKFNAFDSHDADKLRRRDKKKKKKLSHGTQQMTDFFN